mgnify:CR=1 FL=1
MGKCYRIMRILNLILRNKKQNKKSFCQKNRSKVLFPTRKAAHFVAQNIILFLSAKNLD